MLQKLLRAMNLTHVPVEYNYDDVMAHWGKIDRVLDSSTSLIHVECAERMFGQFLHHFAFTDEQRQSPLILGMQNKINTVRSTFEPVRESPLIAGSQDRIISVRSVFTPVRESYGRPLSLKFKHQSATA